MLNYCILKYMIKPYTRKRLYVILSPLTHAFKGISHVVLVILKINRYPSSIQVFVGMLQEAVAFSFKGALVTISWLMLLSGPEACRGEKT